MVKVMFRFTYTDDVPCNPIAPAGTTPDEEVPAPDQAAIMVLDPFANITNNVLDEPPPYAKTVVLDFNGAGKLTVFPPPKVCVK